MFAEARDGVYPIALGIEDETYIQTVFQSRTFRMVYLCYTFFPGDHIHKHQLYTKQHVLSSVWCILQGLSLACACVR